jgi:hypothetical protein
MWTYLNTPFLLTHATHSLLAEGRVLVREPLKIPFVRQRRLYARTLRQGVVSGATMAELAGLPLPYPNASGPRFVTLIVDSHASGKSPTTAKMFGSWSNAQAHNLKAIGSNSIPATTLSV